jgi:hypothetical protein
VVDRVNPENVIQMTKKMCALRAHNVNELEIMARIIHKKVRIKLRLFDL